MRIDNWLKSNVDQLSSAGIATARLDCLVLLEDTLQHDRAWLLSHPEHILQRSELKGLNTKIVQRAQHIPLAYIRGKAEFYGREFAVNAHTLVPRPETETIIDLLKTLQPAPKTKILDAGTGSGCIAITAALELPQTSIHGCDIDEQCLQKAHENAQRIGARNVHFFASDLLENAESYDIILANLPYVPEYFQINTAATHEPKHAIFGGADGLDLYRTMFGQIAASTHKPQAVLCESLPLSHDELAQIAKAAGYQLAKTDDFIQLFTA